MQSQLSRSETTNHYWPDDYKGRKVRVLAFSHSTVVDGCTLARIASPLSFLENSKKVEFALFCVLPWWFLRPNSLVRLLKDLPNWDVIWVARPSHNAILPIIREARRLGKTVLVDIDDWLLEVPAEHSDAQFFRQRVTQAALRTALQLANAVTVSTPLLAERCVEIGMQANVLPNAINLQQFTHKLGEGKHITIAFCGTVTHVEDMSLISIPLLQVLQQWPDSVRVVSVGCSIPGLEGLQGYTHYGYVAASEYARFLSSLHIDIGLAPLHDTPFNRAKSDIKYLEYSALGATTIASSVLPYKDSVHCDRGLLVEPNTPQAWFAAISQVVEDRQMRCRLAINAQEWVRRERSMSVMADSWLRVFLGYVKQSEQNAASVRHSGKLWHYRQVIAGVVLHELCAAIREVPDIISRRWVSRKRMERRGPSLHNVTGGM